MKLRILALAFATLLPAGCATSTYTSGTDFNSANVSRIKRGYTTEADLTRMFGRPYMKTVMSATDTKWIYTYTEGSASVQYNLINSKIQSTGTQKMLDVLLSNGVVTNYTFSDGPIPSSVTTY